jgi:tripartite-type tricarboxylate transporter receptor subunit TctC
MESKAREECMMLRREFLRLSASAAASAPILGIRPVFAADYPTKPVRWVVGYPAGGTTDILARLVGQAMSEKLNQQFIIENKPGAGNNIATEFVINSPPDGYTVYFIRSCRSISFATWPRSAASPACLT